MHEPLPLNLLMYSDYRTYLKEYYETRKAADPNFSFRFLSLRAGINSSAFYKYVIDGKRNLTKSTILKTCLALKLADKDAEYFENLVFFNQAKTIREKNLYFDKLTRLRGGYDRRQVQEAQYAYYGEWRHSAVRELIGCMRFKEDYRTLAALLIPPVGPSEAEESVALLARLGMIRKDAQGRWRQSDPVLTTGGQVEAPDILARCNDRSVSKLDSVPAEARRFVVESRAGWKYDTTLVVVADTARVKADRNQFLLSP